ncbi:MAG: 1-acyl-sn-glycerol-3-phosphate acyltransferase [Rikenellaceae bacterium]
MGSLFVNIYHFLRRYAPLRWSLLSVSCVVMILLSLRVEYVEDITSFFPKGEQNRDIFESLKAKDKIAVMMTSFDDGSQSQYSLMDCADQLTKILSESDSFSQRASYVAGIDELAVDRVTQFIYDNLPLLLLESDYERLERVVTPDSIARIMEQNYDRLISPIGGFIADHLYRDPLGIGGELTRELQQLGNNFSYSIIEDYLFSQDGRTLISYIEPNSNLSSKDTKLMVTSIENSIEKLAAQYPDVVIDYYGAPIVAEHNARQIKQDSIVTLNIALLLVVVLLSIAFRNRYSALLVLLPVLYGALFALSIISIVQGSISIIAVGAGSIIFGIALSYSIHLLSHTLHCQDVSEVIRDLAYPLTVGSFTTIGAFAALTFTSSTILQDLGLFASLTLIGTTIFVLIFSPHFVVIPKDHGRGENRILNFVNRSTEALGKVSGALIVLIVVATIVSAFFAGKVGFDSNMMNLNYEPPHLERAGERLSSFSNSSEGESNVFFIASDLSDDGAASGYLKMCNLLDSLQTNRSISSYSSVARFVVSDSLLRARVDRWQQFWSQHDGASVVAQIERESTRLGFDDGAFGAFGQMFTRDYLDKERYSNSLTSAFSDWITCSDTSHSYMAQVQLSESSKEEVYALISQDHRLIAADRAFFASRMAWDVNHNFSLILLLSSALVFFAMLLCYGRIEITLMAFAPMFVSWIIILGVMAILGVEFNIVTIILSTFIFGIGDDFSIFMMDGLLSEYKDDKRVLAPHKTAIFFSAFTVVVGMGALIFAKHPAMNSLGLISLIGILIVVVVSYTLQPALFRLFISSPTKRGGFPYTLSAILNTVYAFGLFVIGCVILQTLMLVILPLPLGRRRRVAFVMGSTHYLCRFMLKVMVTTKFIKIDDRGEDFSKPAVIIANHQSFIDILMLLALNRRCIMVTNNWVWRSPLFGRIVRYMGFFNTSDGYESIVESLAQSVAEGCSIVVFPEGTRSEDCSVKRFHKGAFYLAEKLKLDIVPVVIYGNGLVSSKRQGIYIKRGLLVAKVLPRIEATSIEYGANYGERAKAIGRYFRAEYHKLYEELNRTSNPYFKDAIIKSYIYKGPVLEWYMRIKLRFEGWYDRYDRLLPRKGLIVDLGCGYGAMSYMLSMLSEQRHILGVDYDEQKIALAQHSFLRSDRIEFRCGDIRHVELPQAAAFVISDVLHYIAPDEQRALIERCLEQLTQGGVVVIKDGDSSLKERHAHTVESERWSTQIMKFNKVDGSLSFLSREMVEAIANRCGADIELLDDNSRLSNIIFVITKR